MSPVTQTPVADTTSQTPPERGSSHQTKEFASWSQWDVSNYPTELLSLIFSYLRHEDIARVRDTCKRFREVVEADYCESLFYHQLSGPYRKHYPQSLSWQKWVIKNHLHPFTAALPDKMSKCFNAEQEAAVVCFQTLRDLMSAPGHRAMEVFSCFCPADDLQVEFSLTSSDLWFYDGTLPKAWLVSQSEAGSWSEQEVDATKLPGFRPSAALGSRTDASFICFFSSDNICEYYRRDHYNNRWKLGGRHLGYANYQFSKPGKYTAIMPGLNTIESIRCFDDQGQWVPMPIEDNARVNNHNIGQIQFSPSEQQLAIVSERDKLVILSLGQGSWNFSGLMTVDQLLHDTEGATEKWFINIGFGPSEDWLLAVLGVQKPASVEYSHIMLRHDSAGKWQYFQRIPTQYHRLEFSLGGRYLTCWKGQKLCELWALQECEKWKLCSNLTHPGTVSLPGLEQTELKQSIIQLSSCDNYLCTISEDGFVSIWSRSKEGVWEIRGRKRYDSPVSLVKFSPSSVLALVKDRSSIHIWRRNESGLWSVNAGISAKGVVDAHFHPVAEHLIVFWNSRKIRIWEIRKEDSSGRVVSPSGETI